MKQKKSRRKRRWGWFVALGLLVVIGIGVLVGLQADAPGRHELEVLEIGEIDFENLRDGTYTGEYVGEAGHLRDAALEVTVSDGQVTNIRLLKGGIDENGDPADLADGQTIMDLFDDVLALKTLQVDAISGATLTSKAHLKALENALLQAQN